MAQITEENFINLIKQEFPDFIPYWNVYVEEGDFNPDSRLTFKMIPFEEHTIDVIKNSNELEIKRIFDFIEFALCNGDDSVQSAVSTEFLEYLMQNPGGIKFGTICKYLGENSLAYCKAWDEFTGVKTEGLW